MPPDPEVLERYERAGVRRVSVWAPSGGRGVIEPALERSERAIG